MDVVYGYPRLHIQSITTKYHPIKSILCFSNSLWIIYNPDQSEFSGTKMGKIGIPEHYCIFLSSFKNRFSEIECHPPTHSISHWTQVVILSGATMGYAPTFIQHSTRKLLVALHSTFDAVPAISWKSLLSFETTYCPSSAHILMIKLSGSVPKK